MDILFTELPGTFRVCGSREDVMAVVNSRVEELARELNVTPEGSEGAVPYLKKLDWYPGGRGWQVSGGRTKLRRQENAELTKLRTFLIDETSIGHLSRQEAVSMIPPLFMNIMEHHKVLDMCASPGSKTAQLLEMLHQNAPESFNPSVIPTSQHHDYQSLVRGFVHANDVNGKRCNTLITQTKRISSPSLFVTQHDAQQLPVTTLLTPSELAELVKPPKVLSPCSLPTLGPFLYDRILCDVPCSGDGTVRKNADLWLGWHPQSGHGLHSVQKNILARAISLSAPGARIVYSTCSMNPVEDEAVIAAAIQNAEHKMQLVDVSSVLPLLKFRPGVSKWRCMDNAGTWYSSFEEVPETLQTKLVASSFPPAPEIAEKLHLERCMRFLPHDQDTGGFFVAVLERCDGEAQVRDLTKKEKRAKYRKPQPAEYEKLDLDISANIFELLKNFFELNENFPFHQLVKHQKGLNKLYLTTESAAILMDHDHSHRLRVKSIGVRVFESLNNTQGSSSNYRITQDGAASLFPFLGPRRIVNLAASDLEILFNAEDPLFDTFSPETAKKLQEMEIGSVVFSYFVPMGPHLPPHHILLVGWRGKVSTHTLVKPSEVPAFMAAFKARFADS
jgi:tRNA (cytosine34-C5)-methyltransferase